MKMTRLALMLVGGAGVLDDDVVPSSCRGVEKLFTQSRSRCRDREIKPLASIHVHTFNFATTFHFLFFFPSLPFSYEHLNQSYSGFLPIKYLYYGFGLFHFDSV